MVSKFKQRYKLFNERWRGQFATLRAATQVCIHVCTLQERMKGPRYDVFGPWHSFWELDGVSDHGHQAAMAM